MQVPVQVDFQGCDPEPRLRERIDRGLESLESRFGRIIAARVAICGPGGHHRTGGRYEIGVHLTLPDGRLVNVEHTPDADERYGDVDFAIGDAFRRARRQLQDEYRRMDGKVKRHQPQAVAKVARLDETGEFGFLRTAAGDDIYFHRNSVLDGAFPRLKPGTAVAFTEEIGEEGPQASTVRLLGKHNMRS
jgi:cold shock CspA family protein